MKKENMLLKLSALGGLFFALLGLGWGVAIDSEMIIFDGLYSLISLFLSLIAIKVCSFMDKSDKINFPFGKENLNPILIIIKSIVLIIMCSISLFNSFKTLISGGNPVNTSFAIIYTIVSIVGCGSIYIYMKIASKKFNSDILKVESMQWLMDGLISLGVFIGFIIVIIIENTFLNYLSNYIDPLMVIITSIIFLKLPFKSLIQAFKELILVKANDDINNHINEVVKNIETEYNFEDSIVRVSKTGNSIRIEIDFIFNNSSKLKSLDEMDKIRELIFKHTNNIKYNKWLNISFTGNREWVI